MDLILIIAIGAIVAVTGVINPNKQDPEEVAKASETQVTTPVVKEPEPVPEPTPAPEPEPEPTPAPEPEPEPTPAPEPEPEEPKEEVNSEQAKEQDAKPEEEEITPAQEETVEASEDKGLSMLNIILYILGAIAVIAAGIYFFMRREPVQSAADIARSQSQDSTPEPLEEQPVQEETYSEPEPETEQPVQEETPSETTEEQSQTDNTDQSSSSNNDDENNNNR
jgi:flagellar basal body-associated protein FliL